MAELKNASEAKLIRCIISRQGKDSKPLGKDMVIAFESTESVGSPFMTGSLTVSDSKNFINEYPIEGGENISIEIQSTFSDAPIVYKFVISRIANKIVKNIKQAYTLMLCSPEAIINETVRVLDPLEGTSENIVKKMLGKQYLASTKELYSEPSRFEVKMNASRDRPFDIIAKLLKKSVSVKTNYGGTNSTNTTETAQQIKGSAGFFFWETRRGYMFFSIDALCDSADGKFSAPRLNFVRELTEKSGEDLFNPDISAWGPYKEAIANTDLDRDQRFLISEAGMKSEIDLMQSFRKGKYSSVMIFFNHSTGAYEEYVYKLKESYDNMAHLGGQESVSLVPNNEKGELSDYPTRVMTMILDHESWFNEPGIANPEDPNATDPNKFADWQKYYTAQGIARAELLRNQEGEIKIPGNPLICAGDKIDIRIASKLASELRKKKPYDEETSGVYLIRKIIHKFDFTDGLDGICKTTLELFRDSYGVKAVSYTHLTLPTKA
mgnify:CR=1 FL=1